MKNWNNLGKVTVRCYNGTSKAYKDIEEACRDVGWYYIDQLKSGMLSYYSRFAEYREPRYLKGSFYTPVYLRGDTHIFLDELGLAIPVWKVQEVSRSIKEKTYFGRGFWRNHPFDYEKNFRNGALPFIRCRRGGHHSLRHIRTTAEHRENAFMLFDEECIEFGIKARGKRRGHNLPTLYDDIPREYRNLSWKKYRNKQYKVE